MEYLVTEGQRLGLTIGPVHTVAQAAQHPHLRARDAFVEIDHPVAGRFEYPRSLVQMTATPPESTRAPLLGEHNADSERLGSAATSCASCKGRRDLPVEHLIDIDARVLTPADLAAYPSIASVNLAEV